MELEELELYDNKILKLENIQHLKKLKTLDLSFNNIKKLENVDGFENL